jgi:hypothetical protein
MTVERHVKPLELNMHRRSNWRYGSLRLKTGEVAIIPGQLGDAV